MITTIGVDADDTLWHNENVFRLTQERFRGLLAGIADPDVLDERLAETERRNLRLYGYGVKGFTLSMIETAMELTGNEAPGRVIADILAAGREMLSHPVETLPGVREVLAELSADYRLVPDHQGRSVPSGTEACRVRAGPLLRGGRDRHREGRVDIPTGVRSGRDWSGAGRHVRKLHAVGRARCARSWRICCPRALSADVGT